MTDRELMQQALEALDYEAERGNDDGYRQLRDALRERLEQPEQEPIVKWDATAPLVVHPHPAFKDTPPQRKPMTDEECDDLWDKQLFYITDKYSAREFIRDVEAAHDIKGDA